MKFRIGLFAMLVVAGSFPFSAFAVLGGDVSSIKADQSQLGGTLQITQRGTVTVHEIQAASGTAVKEYVSPAGMVFAVTWSGPSLPDLRQLLGRYFDVYTEAVRVARPGPGPVSVQQPGLVVQSGGRMRAFVGRAYVPSMIPQGMSADQIQ